MRGSTRSSAKTVWPVTLAAASTLGSGWPTTLSATSCSFGSSATDDLRGAGQGGGVGGLLAAQAGGRQLDGLEDLEVAGAAAEIARQRLRDLGAGGLRVLAQQGLRPQQEARDAVAALGGPQLREG